jgi:serine/threonine protein kinase
MVTSELGACEWFVWDLRRSNLIDRGQLDQIVGEFLSKHPRAEPPDLAQFLITQGILTDFQAERLLAGKTQGFVLGPFTLMDALGAGSMGTVYKAHSKTDDQWYAVKVLPRRSMWNVRIARRKVRAFEQCKHPSVVPFVDVGTAGGMHYLAWPLVEGTGLDKVVESQGKIDPRKAAHYAVQIAEALDICHNQGLIHGLVKPSNLLIGAEDNVFILDFGIGCLLAETEGESLVDTMSTANAVASGLDCSSPESIMDPTNLTPAGDQYSLGCVLYYMLAGQYPFPDGSAAEKMMAHQLKQPTPIRDLNPDVPEALASIIEKLMQKSPEQRFGSVHEAVEALKAVAQQGRSSMFASPRKPGSIPGVTIPRSNPPMAAPTGGGSSPAMQRPGLPPRPTGPASVPPRPSAMGGIPPKSNPPFPSPSAKPGLPARPQTMVGPSTQTPRPALMPQLPGRQSLRPQTMLAHAEPAASNEAQGHEAPQERVIPGAIEDPKGNPETRMSPLTVMFAAIGVFAVIYLIAQQFNLIELIKQKLQ